MEIIQSAWFKKTVKKLKANQKEDLDKAIAVIIEDPCIGKEKNSRSFGYQSTQI